MRTIRDAKFVPQWVDLTQEYPAPLFGHITRQYLNLSYGGHPLQAVDLYLPEEGKPPFPRSFWSTVGDSPGVIRGI